MWTRSAGRVTPTFLLCPRYAHVLTPYVNSVPAVIAKASAIHNPIIYALTHSKYRFGTLSPQPPGLWSCQRLVIIPASWHALDRGLLAGESSHPQGGV